MKRDIVIGSGNHGCTAILCFSHPEIKNVVSENDVSYWIWSHELIFDCRLFIFKNTEQGKILKRLIDGKKSKIEIIKFLNKELINQLDIDDIVEGIELLKKKSFAEGRRNKSEEIRTVLTTY